MTKDKYSDLILILQTKTVNKAKTKSFSFQEALVGFQIINVEKILFF